MLALALESFGYALGVSSVFVVLAKYFISYDQMMKSLGNFMLSD